MTGTLSRAQLEASMWRTCAIALTIILLVACNTSGPVVVPGMGKSQFGPIGYVCTTSPTSAYSPGYIFRTDSQGVQHLATDRSHELKDQLTVHTIEFGTHTLVSVVSAGVKAELLSALGPVAKAEAGLNGGRTGETTISFSGGKWLQMDDPVWNQLKDYAGNLPREADSKYYVVRDAIAATSITMRFSDEDKVRLAGNASVKDVIELKPELKYETTDLYDLKIASEQPLNVCIKTVRLLFPGDTQAGIAGEGEHDVAAATALLSSRAAY